MLNATTLALNATTLALNANTLALNVLTLGQRRSGAEVERVAGQRDGRGAHEGII